MRAYICMCTLLIYLYVYMDKYMFVLCTMYDDMRHTLPIYIYCAIPYPYIYLYISLYICDIYAYICGDNHIDAHINIFLIYILSIYAVIYALPIDGHIFRDIYMR